MDPNVPAGFSTKRFSLPPNPNSAAVMSLSGSYPAQLKLTVSGRTPEPGLTDKPLHRGGLFVGVGVSVGVADGVGVRVGVTGGVSDGVAVGVRSARLRISWFCVPTAQRIIGRPKKIMRMM